MKKKLIQQFYFFYFNHFIAILWKQTILRKENHDLHSVYEQPRYKTHTVLKEKNENKTKLTSNQELSFFFFSF